MRSPPMKPRLRVSCLLALSLWSAAANAQTPDEDAAADEPASPKTENADARAEHGTHPQEAGRGREG